MKSSYFFVLKRTSTNIPIGTIMLSNMRNLYSISIEYSPTQIFLPHFYDFQPESKLVQANFKAVSLTISSYSVIFLTHYISPWFPACIFHTELIFLVAFVKAPTLPGPRPSTNPTPETSLLEFDEDDLYPTYLFAVDHFLLECNRGGGCSGDQGLDAREGAHHRYHRILFSSIFRLSWYARFWREACQ